MYLISFELIEKTNKNLSLAIDIVLLSYLKFLDNKFNRIAKKSTRINSELVVKKTMYSVKSSEKLRNLRDC